MGNWYDDIDYALEEIIRTKLSQVIDELKEEYYLNIDTKNDVYHYFKNSKKTGIIDRAEKYLGLRFDELQAINEKEKSDALSLAKYLYLVEMNYPLLKVMSNPSLAQTTIYGEKSGNEDEDIVAIIAEKIKTRTTLGYADRSDSCYYEILNDWLYIRSELTNCIIDSYFSLNQLDDNCYEIPQELAYAAAELLEKSKAKKTKEQKEIAIEISEAVKSNRIKTDHHSSQKTYLSVIIEYLEAEFDYIVQNIDRGRIADLPYNYGVFDIFYTCFSRYYVLRCFSDIPNEENAGIKASLDVESFFSQYADSAILFSHLEVVENLLSGRSSKAEFEQLYFLEKMKDMIQEGVPVELKDADMRFALKHLKTVAEWWMPDKLDDNYINVIAAITVMQELAYLYNTKLKYTYQYNKHDDPKPFSAIISKPDKADEMFKSVMTERLNERFMANIGGDVWSKLHSIRESICSIIDILMSYVNIDDAQMASYALYGYAENVLKSVSVPQSTAELFIEAINANITCGVSVEAIEENCYLTRLLHEKEYDLLSAAAKIAKEWDKYALQGQMFIAIVNVGYSFSVKILADTSKGKIQILELWNRMKPYELNKLSKLGLGEIFNE